MRYIVFIVILLITPFFVEAHPGRTASDGCHYCRTNCSSWGEVANERHCHGGITPPTTNNPSPTPAPAPDPTPVIIPSLTSAPAVEEDNLLISVSRIIDGDTFEFIFNSQKEKVRIIGIDTPESVDPRKPIECFSKEATTQLSNLILNKEVKLVRDFSGDNRGTYGRLIRYVKSTDGSIDYGAEMIKQGFAYAYVKYPFTQSTMNDYKQYEKNARDSGQGLWADGVCGNDTAAESEGIDGQDGINATVTNTTSIPVVQGLQTQPSSQSNTSTDDSGIVGLTLLLPVIGGIFYYMGRRVRKKSISG